MRKEDLHRIKYLAVSSTAANWRDENDEIISILRWDKDLEVPPTPSPAEVPSGVEEGRIRKLLYEDDFKQWRIKNNWHFHNDFKYRYQLDRPGQWPPSITKYDSELRQMFNSQYIPPEWQAQQSLPDDKIYKYKFAVAIEILEEIVQPHNSAERRIIAQRGLDQLLNTQTKKG